MSEKAEKSEPPKEEPTLKEIVEALGKNLRDLTVMIEDHEKRITKLEAEIF